ncbi:hypothetical protein [Pararhodospirillum photometricum]|nr:hypothetical protein [Pararhodospirillum photometricum]
MTGLWAAVGLVLALAMATPVFAGDDGPRFILGMDDIPLMPVLTPMPGAGMVFDSPAGRLVEAYATGTVSASQVLSFYRDTLPQLGWQVHGPHSFVRDGEILDLDFTGGSSTLTVRFSLAPGG